MPRPQINCPFHPDRTASLTIYAETDSYFCFGCRRHGPISDLGDQCPDLSTQKEVTYVEDVPKTLEAIRALPAKEVRGLSLHCDSSSFYLIWPSNSYYIRRLIDPGNGSKYRCPVGVPRPLYVSPGKDLEVLILVEGELNAASIAASTNYWVCSPGSAGEFKEGKMYSNLPLFQLFTRFLVITDDDAPGIKAAVNTKSWLLKYFNNVTIRLCAKGQDANDWLRAGGKERVRQEVNKALGM